MIGIQGGSVKDYVDAMKDQDKEVQDYGTMEGVRIDKVVEDGAAADADLKSEDVITMVDDKKVKTMGDLQAIIAQKRPGDKVTVKYLRNKKEKTATLTLKNEQGNTKVVKNADLDVLGGSFRAITDAQKEQLNIGYGLEVIKINGGKLKDAGMPKGFIIQKVNDQSIKSIEDLQETVKEASTSKEPVLYIQGIYPTGKKGYFAVPLANE
jgi:S1-C subfamily serine protease